MSVDSKRVQAVFLAAIECSEPSERAAVLERHCGNDLPLRQRVEALLKAHDEPEDLPKVQLDLGGATFVGPLAYSAGTLIAGRYKLLEEIAEGGMGAVWLAQQTEPIRRRVALKLIKPGMDSRQVLSRFEVERQALALMDHPNIAKVFDGGVTDQGRPFFVMEYVKGIPITQYCDEVRLTVRERLTLFMPVCLAVQHAHQKGIIHRDLKPSNILVCLYDGQPVPKVIDFGLAKAMHQPLTEQTLFTAHGVMVGTPLYMSPEQAEFNNLDIDTRTDVYSLGVILYELLTGTTPLEKQQFKGAAWQEILRLIKEEEPSKPSTKVSCSASLPTVAAQRGLEPVQLSRTVRGELDWIVMKSLEKERSRRYDTANGLAKDIGRFLSDQPVDAGPPSTVYRFRTFARRNRTVIATSAVILLTLVIGMIGSISQAIRATRAERIVQTRLDAEMEARNEAERAQKAEAEQRSLAESQRAAAEESRQQANESARLARKTVDEYFTLVSESQLLDVPGLQPLREKLLESALHYYKSFRDQPGGDSSVRAELAATRLRIAQVYEQNNRVDDSIRELGDSLDLVDGLIHEHPLPDGFPQCLAGFRRSGRILNYFTLWPSDPQETIRVREHAVSLWKEFVRQHPDVVGFRADLACFYCDLSDIQYCVSDHVTALRYAQAAQELLEGLVAQHPREAEYLALLAESLEYVSRELRSFDRKQDAESALRRALTIRSQLVTDFPDVPNYRAKFAYSHVRLASLLSDSKRTEEASAAFQQAVDRWRILAAEFPADPGFRKRLTDTLCRFAATQRHLGKSDDAEKLLREAVEISVKLAKENVGEKGDNVSHAVEAHKELALVLRQNGRHSEAKEQLVMAMDGARSLSERFPENDAVGHGFREFAFAAVQNGQIAEAEQAFHGAIESFQRVSLLKPKEVTPRHFLADTHLRFAWFLSNGSRPIDAEKEYRLAIEIHEKCAAELRCQPVNPHEWADSYWNFAAFLVSRGRHREAKEVYDRLVTLTQKLAQEHPDNVSYRMQSHSANQLAWNLVVDEKADAQWFRFAVELSKKVISQAPRDGSFWNTLGVAEYRCKNWSEAEAALLKGFDLRGPGFSDTWFFLAMTAWQRGQPEQARKWYNVACLWTARHAPKHAELTRFCAEASTLLGIPEIVQPENLDDFTLMQALVEADPNTKAEWCWYVLFEHYVRAGHWADAKPYAIRWAELQPDSPDCQYQLAALLARTGDRAAYEKCCQKLLRKFAETTQPEWAERTAKVSLILLPSAEILVAASRMANRSVTLDESHWSRPWACVAAALAAYRQHDFRSSLEWCDKALTKENDDGWFRTAEAYYIRAQTLNRLDKNVEAKAALEKAEAILHRMQADAKETGVQGWWHDLAICELMQQESEDRLKTSSK